MDNNKYNKILKYKQNTLGSDCSFGMIVKQQGAQTYSIGENWWRILS